MKSQVSKLFIKTSVFVILVYLTYSYVQMAYSNSSLLELEKLTTIFDQLQGIDNESILGERLRFFDRYFKHSAVTYFIPKIFPFLQNNSLLSSERYQGKGIVICVGDKDEKNLLLALSSLIAIQTVLKSSLPIELFYMGQEDLSKESREKLLSQLANLQILNLLEFYPNLQHIENVKGFNMKPFALLASSFEHAVLMDADAVFLKDPVKIFETSAYLNTGTAFFHDRWIRTRHGHANNRQKTFLKSIIGKGITKYNLRILQQDINNHEQESGVVGYDKKRHFTSLLSACSIISLTNSNEAGYGDKEMFWLGAAVLGKDFEFVDSKSGAGVFGHATKSDLESSHSSICGPHILHVSEDLTPFWFNGGIMSDKTKGLSKNRPNTPTVNSKFKSWLVASMKDAEWKGGVCLHANENAKEFTEEELFVLNETGEIFKRLLK